MRRKSFKVLLLVTLIAMFTATLAGCGGTASKRLILLRRRLDFRPLPSATP